MEYPSGIYLYGKLNKEITTKEYEGSTTDTAITSVTDSAIKVDVIKVPNKLNIKEAENLFQEFDGSKEVVVDLTSYAKEVELLDSVELVSTSSDQNKLIFKDKNGNEITSVDISGDISNFNLKNGLGDYSISHKYLLNNEDYSSIASGENSVALTGKRYDIPDWPTAQSYGKQSLALGASCESFGDFSLTAGCGAKAYQRVGIAIGKSCKSGLTQKDFNDMFATDEQKALEGYDATKLNGGLDIQILDDYSRTYDISEALSLATGVDTEAYGYGAFASGSGNKSLAKNATTFGDNNTNSGESSFITGIQNTTDVPFTVLLGSHLSRLKSDPNYVAGDQIILGHNNAEVKNAVVVVGTGHSSSDKANSLEVYRHSVNVPETLTVGNVEEGNKYSAVNLDYLTPRLNSKSNATNIVNGDSNYSVKTNIPENVITNSACGVALGYSSTILNNKCSSILGGLNNSIAAGEKSVILNGQDNRAGGANTIVGGLSNQCYTDNAIRLGKYAKIDTSLFSVGNGASGSNRSNAFSVGFDGRAQVQSAPEGSTDIVRKQELDAIDTRYEEVTSTLSSTKLDKTGGIIDGTLSIKENLNVTGNLNVSGTATAVKTQSLLVVDNIIATNADKKELTTLLSGLALNKNADETYGVMYDPVDNTVKFGQGTLSESGVFTFSAGEGKPLAIRAQSGDLTENHLIKWDSTTNSFIDSGISSEDIAILNEDNILTGKNTFTGEVDFSGSTYHNADVTINNSIINILDNTDGKDHVAQYGADGIKLDENSSNYEYKFPLESGTFALTKDINDKVGFKYYKLENKDTQTDEIDTITSTELGAQLNISHTDDNSSSGVSVSKDFVSMYYNRPATTEVTAEGASVSVGDTVISLESAETVDGTEKNTQVTIDPDGVKVNGNPLITKIQDSASNEFTPDENGVVTIPKGSYKNLGLLGIQYGNNGYMGLQEWTPGYLSISAAGKSIIDSRALLSSSGEPTGTYKPIVPSAINYAVKAALTDDKRIGTETTNPTTFTDTEKDNACEILGAIRITGDQTISGVKTFSNYLKTDQIDSQVGKGLVRYKSIEGKSVFGNDSTAAVLMGNTDRPYYSNSGSDFTGVELALKSDVNNLQGTTETATVLEENWIDLTDKTPFAYQAEITATATIGDDTEVGVVNNNPLIYANYGIVVGAVSGQKVTLWAIDKPTEAVDITILIRG